jgi:PAS domain S-box-containing protein
MGAARSRKRGKHAGDVTDSRQDAWSRLEATAREFASGRAAQQGDPERRWRAWLEDNFVFVCIYSPDGTLIAANPAALAAAGVLAEEVIGRHVTQMAAIAHSPEATARAREVLEQAARGETLRTELSVRLHGGRLVRIDCLVCPLRDASGRVIEIATSSVEILTQWEESALVRLNRELRMVSACTEVLVRARNETALLDGVCRVMVEAGRYALAWVGFAQNDAAQSIKAVARAGDDQGYLDRAQISWADAERGRGPTGRAFRTRQVQLSRNMQDDPSLAPWREAASQRGYRSSIALPLLAAGQALGVLTIYSDRTNAFDESEVTLLTALASDLAYGIDALRAHAERERALEEVRDLAGQLVRVQDDVRRLVGRDLHDSTGQSLAALVMNLQRLAGSAEALPPERRELLTQSIALAQQCVTELRTTSYLLHPPLLDERGLGSALRWLARGFGDRSGIEVALDVPEELGRFDADSELALFRVAQEALTNVQRHSGSRTVHLSAAVADDSIVLEIRDAGRGMQHTGLLREAREPILSVGLAGMRERMRQLGGTVTVVSGPEGTCVHASLPLQRAV